MMINLRKENIDPDLEQMLKAYDQNTPQRKHGSEIITREMFAIELEKMFSETGSVGQPAGRPQSLIKLWVSDFNQLKESLAMNFAQRSARTVLSSILILVVLLFGGGGIITAYAAKAALPGDALYPVKTSIENTQVSLSGNQATQARLYLGFAGSRLAEIQALINDGRTSYIANTASQFEEEVQKALDAIEELSRTDPSQADALRAEAVEIIKTYSETLNLMLASAPIEIQPIISNAIKETQPEAPSGNVNENANLNGNGSDDNNNSNTNANSNDSLANANGNANANANANDDSGLFEDNDNDNNNSNANSNSNDKLSNANGNDNDNGNGNGNSNSNDDSSHFEDNGNTNSNNNDSSFEDNSNTNSNSNGRHSEDKSGSSSSDDNGSGSIDKNSSGDNSGSSDNSGGSVDNSGGSSDNNSGSSDNNSDSSDNNSDSGDNENSNSNTNG